MPDPLVTRISLPPLAFDHTWPFAFDDLETATKTLRTSGTGILVLAAGCVLTDVDRAFLIHELTHRVGRRVAIASEEPGLVRLEADQV
jgi:hypothetical protein